MVVPQTTYEAIRAVYFQDKLWSKGERMTVHSRTIVPIEDFRKISGTEFKDPPNEEVKEAAKKQVKKEKDDSSRDS